MEELTKIIKKTAQKLGVELAYYPENGRRAGVPVCDKTFEGITDDGTHTFFRFFFRGVGYIGVLNGVGEQANGYAMLLPVYLESCIDREEEISKTDYLKRVLRGDVSSLGVYKYAAKFSVLGIACYAMVLRVPTCLAEVLDIVRQYVGNSLDVAVDVDEHTCVLVKFLGANGEEDALGVAYAEVLVQSLQEELAIDVSVGIGPIVRDIKEIAQSYACAENALRYADIFEVKGNVHAYQSFTLLKVLENVAPAKLEAYASEFIGEGFQEIYKDAEMLETAEEFLRNSLNISETSRNLFMHRNTLLYRLDKIEKATGLNIRLFPDALSFYVLTAIYRLLGK